MRPRSHGGTLRKPRFGSSQSKRARDTCRSVAPLSSPDDALRGTVLPKESGFGGDRERERDIETKRGSQLPQKLIFSNPI